MFAKLFLTTIILFPVVMLFGHCVEEMIKEGKFTPKS